MPKLEIQKVSTIWQEKEGEKDFRTADCAASSPLFYSSSLPLTRTEIYQTRLARFQSKSQPSQRLWSSRRNKLELSAIWTAQVFSGVTVCFRWLSLQVRGGCKGVSFSISLRILLMLAGAQKILPLLLPPCARSFGFAAGISPRMARMALCAKLAWSVVRATDKSFYDLVAFDIYAFSGVATFDNYWKEYWRAAGSAAGRGHQASRASLRISSILASFPWSKM
ncbi:hypothetical protein K438DRAFT_1759908 [Mycena galopus ATCC 62051]|nr:hypothetical protein K438DRAFT_1759908 [Mycena galopus ATCC 62051]